MATDQIKLSAFLIEAKRKTYAGLDDEASVAAPLLANSKQLEHRAGVYAYRDIYFGMNFFVGLETVAENDLPIWSMAYSGGVIAAGKSDLSVPALYKFLRSALLVGTIEKPFRGPDTLVEADFAYANLVAGTLEKFQGFETIHHCGALVYEMRYSGGLFR